MVCSKIIMPRKQKLKGGLGDRITVYNVNPLELALGSIVEMEHTDNPYIAIEIALDHLAEFPEYYSKILLPAEKTYQSKKRSQTKSKIY